MHPNREELIFIPFLFFTAFTLLSLSYLFICLLFCDFMLKTLRTMFDLSVGG